MRRSKRGSAAAVIAKARLRSNIFAEFQLPTELPRSRLKSVRLRCDTGGTLSPTDREWILESIKSSLKGMYETSTMKWDETEKQDEMVHADQRFLIAWLGATGEKVGFLSYRWDVEEGRAVMYVYEVSVVEKFRGNGVGCALMLYAEELCRRQDVGSIMLTVFFCNRPAISLYRDKLKYDAHSPSYRRQGFFSNADFAMFVYFADMLSMKPPLANLGMKTSDTKSCPSLCCS